MKLSSLLVFTGGIAYVCVIATVFTGILRANLKWHKLLAIIAVSLATLHGVLIIYMKFFR